MSALSLSLLGPFQAALGDRPLRGFRTSKVQALLVYLVTESCLATSPDMTFRREALMELLWPGLPLKSAQVNLRQTLYQLRRAVPEMSARDDLGSVPLLLSDRQVVRIHSDADVRADVARFAELLPCGPAHTSKAIGVPAKLIEADFTELVEAVELYRGDFLSDFFLSDSADFEDWAGNRRAEFRRHVLDALDKLIDHFTALGEYDQAQIYAWRALEIDDLRESAHRGLMKALAQDGQRTAALAQYQICRKRLWGELGVEPSAETSAVYQQVQADALQESRLRQPMPSLRRGMPVFLFTDIEASTPKWETHREAMLPALLTHNRVLEEQIALHGGRILELRGDGVKAVFEGVDPLPCVLAIQVALSKQAWGPVGEVRIRIGLHGLPPQMEGEEYFLQGDQYYGPALHHAHRVMDAGHGGQILVSEQVRNAFPLPPGATWHDFGKHQLKGFEEPQAIFGLLHPDLPLQEFPLLRALSEPEPATVPEASVEPESGREQELLQNLPPQPMPFVGRESELAELNRLLAAPEVQMVTVLGAGGMGKTRLALEAARAQLRRYPDGVYFIPLAGTEAADDVVPNVARAVGFSFFQESGPGFMVAEAFSPPNPHQQLLDYLRHKRLLLILDNFEHLLAPPFSPFERGVEEGATGLVSDILNTAAQIKLLVTSRAPLNLQGEQHYRLGGMRYPDGEAVLDETLDAAACSALRLFSSAAQRVQPEFELTPANISDVIWVCRLVHGTPLAIVLAAAWVTTLTLAEIAQEIERGTDLLETALRDVPERQRSVRATFDYSWRLLSERQREVFAGLSVFRGGCTHGAARAVTGATLLELRALVEWSLLAYVPAPVTDSGAKGRYHMHELLRHYAAEKLAALPEAHDAARERHCATYVDALDKWEEELKGPEQGRALAEMDVEIDNVRVAWSWAAQHRQVERLDRALDGLARFYEVRIRLRDGEEACRSAAAHFDEEKLVADGKGDALRVLARVLAIQALFAQWLGEEAEAGRLLDRSQAILDGPAMADFDTRREKALVAYHCGHCAWGRDFEQAEANFRQSVTLYRALGDRWKVSRVLGQLGTLIGFTGAYKEAQRLLQESLAISRALEDRDGTALSLSTLGIVMAATGRFEEGVRWVEESVSIWNELCNPAGVAYGLGQLGPILPLVGRFSESCSVLEERTQILADLGVRLVPGYGKMWRGLAELHLGHYARARSLGQAALEIARKAGQKAHIARTLWLLGGVALAEEVYPEAFDLLTQSVVAYQEYGLLPYERGLALSDLTLAERGLGQSVEVRQSFREALQTIGESSASISLVGMPARYALLLADVGAVERAVELYALSARYPYVAKSRWYEQVLGRHVAAAAIALPSDAVASAQERGRRRDLWDTAAELLQELSQPDWAAAAGLPTLVNNLPHQHTPFIGRDKETDDLDELIADPNTRLITIVGPGGMGKTRLAIATAERQLTLMSRSEGAPSPRFPDGIFFVPLAALSTPEQIAPAIAEALRFQFSAGERDSRTPGQQLLDYLREKHALLVLDNFEHLLDHRPSGNAVDLVIQMLLAAPFLRLLVTSRERLLLHEEQVYTITGLPFPDLERLEAADEQAIVEYAAAELFIQSARRVQPGFELENGDLTNLARICRLLDGMPLGVELAAAWVDVLSLADIASEIQNSLDFLETEWRDVPERHRSVRAVFDASWGRLRETERNAFAQLSVFRGGFSRAAAQEVTGAGLRTLAKLVNKSLLTFDKDQDRYAIHDLLCQYGAGRLTREPDAEADARNRHSAFFCSALERWEVDMKGAGQFVAFAEIEAELENVRAAWEWTLSQRDVRRIDAALDGLYHFYRMRLRFQDGYAVCRITTEGLAEITEVNQTEAGRVLARALTWQADFERELWQRERAGRSLRRSHELLAEADLTGQDVRYERAFLLRMQGVYALPDFEQGHRLFAESLAIFRSLGDKWQVAQALLYSALANDMFGKLGAAAQMYEQSLGSFQGMGDQVSAVVVLVALAQSSRRRGAYDEAERRFKEALALSQAHGDHIHAAYSMAELGFLALFQGEFVAGKEYLERCIASYLEQGNLLMEVVALANLGAAHWLSGEFDQACAPIDAGRKIAAQSVSVFNSAVVATYEAQLKAYVGKYEAACSRARRALSAADGPSSWFILGRSYGIIGWAELAQERYVQAAQSLEESLKSWRFGGDREYEAWALIGVGRAAYGLGDGVTARARLLEALEIVEEMRAFIMLLHLMPLIPVVLVDAEDIYLKERAVELYALAVNHPFVAGARLFEEIAGRYVKAAAAAALPPEVFAAAEARGRGLDWWETTEALLDQLRQLRWAG